MAKNFKDLAKACWKGYKAVGLKDKNGKKVPNCVPIEESHVEFRLDHRDKATGDVKKTVADHEAKVSDTTDKATYFKVPKHKADSFKTAMKGHGVKVELEEEILSEEDEIQSADYKLSKSGKKVKAKHIVFHNQDDDEDDKKDVKESVAVAPVPGDKWKDHAVMTHKETKQRLVIQRKNKKNYPESEGWKETSPGMKEETILEASYKGDGKVETKKYSWGAMKTVHHGSDFSIPLHPEHHKEIAKLKDEQEHHFKDETGRHWTARRKGEHVHFQGATGGNSTKVKHEDLKEQSMLSFKEKLDEISKKTTGEYIKSASNDKMSAANELGVQGSKLTIPQAQKLIGKINKRNAGISKAVDRLTKEETEQLDEISKKTLSSYVKKASSDLANKGAALGKKQADADEVDRYTNRHMSNQSDERERMKKAVGADHESISKTRLGAIKRSKGIGKAADRLAKEEVEIISEDDFHGAAQKHLELATAAKNKGDKSAYHAHMADHHDYMVQWHESKGRGREAEKHADKAADHHDASMKEEVEHLEEANHRELAAQGKMHPSMAKHMEAGREMDFYAHGTGDKMSGKVIKNDGKSVHVKVTHNPYKEKDSSVHKFTVSEEVSKSDVPAYLRKQKGEAPLTLKDLKRKDTISDKDNLAKLRGVKEELKGDQHKLDKNKNGKLDKQDFKILKKEEADNFESGVMETSVKSYKDFVQSLNEYNSTDGTYRHKGNYGGSHQDDDEDDEDKPKAKPAGEKRGRGRPKGSNSGARQKGTASGGKTNGADYTGYKLHLPNSNK